MTHFEDSVGNLDDDLSEAKREIDALQTRIAELHGDLEISKVLSENLDTQNNHLKAQLVNFENQSLAFIRQHKEQVAADAMKQETLMRKVKDKAAAEVARRVHAHDREQKIFRGVSEVERYGRKEALDQVKRLKRLSDVQGAALQDHSRTHERVSQSLLQLHRGTS